MANTIDPNQRFGATFLSILNKKHAENSELLLDKVTGQIYLKRKDDGKVITYFQTDESLYSNMLELTILFKNFESLTTPVEESAAIVSTDYNVSDVLQGVLPNILQGEMIDIPTSVVNLDNRMDFKSSKAANGFFIKLISRNIDTNFMEAATSMYDIIFKNYTGSNTEYLAEKAKFDDPTYEGSNATVTYNITVVGSIGGVTTTNQYVDTQNIRINQRDVNYLPDNIFTTYDTIDTIDVSTTRIIFPKFKVLGDYITANPDTDTSLYDHLYPVDDQLIIDYVNITTFIDDINDAPITNNTVTIYVFNVDYLYTYIGRTNKLSDSAGFIISGERPTEAEWTTDNVWAEVIEWYQGGGTITPVAHETDIPAMIDYLFTDSGETVDFTDNPLDAEDILVDEAP